MCFFFFKIRAIYYLILESFRVVLGVVEPGIFLFIVFSPMCLGICDCEYGTDGAVDSYSSGNGHDISIDQEVS